MTIREDIARAERAHAPRLHLFRAAVESKRQELQFENSMAHKVSMHMNSFTGAIAGLVECASTPLGWKMVEREIKSMEDEKMRTAAMFVLSYMVPEMKK